MCAREAKHDFVVKLSAKTTSKNFACSFVLTLFLSPTESKALAITSKAPPAKDGAPRRSLNLEDYKKRRGLI